ncbi:MAG: phage tail sheath family protein [Oscillospiraceae bacterium]|nr:phage tail sheath family protein [Oscillospiraceae bacterium]
MAGGTFDKLTGKTRPGTYVNFESSKTDSVTSGSRGTVVVPILSSVYGPAGEWIKLTAASPDAAYAKLGYSVYDEDEGRQMLLIREAFKGASTVYVYIAAEGEKATGTDGSLTATAKYGGTRGNALTVTVAADSLTGYNVTVSLDGTKVAYYEQLDTIEELIAEDCAYVTFTGSGDLTAIAGLNLTGGTDAEATNAQITAFLDALEAIRFNTVCFPVSDSSLQAAALTKVKYLRESMGRGVQFVMPDYDADYEGIISVVNSVKIDDDSLTHAEACAWVAGATAGATYTESLTYRQYDGATEVVDALTHEEAVQAIKNGEFFFSISEAGNVVVEYDINSLITFADGKDETYRKNRVIRVLDSFQDTLQTNFPPNKYDNSSTGWDIMEGIGKTVLKLYEDAGAITDVDYDNDFLVDREMSSGDQTYFDVGIQPVDSAEKLYFTVKTR